jgi:hypothetical protein
MAGGRDYRAEYARRIARATAAGKSRQAARGHQAREHVARAQREREEYGGLSGYEIRAMRAWCDRRAREIHDNQADADEVIEYFQDRENPYEDFKVYRDTWTSVRREYVGAGFPSAGLGYSLEGLTARAGVEDLSWLYYH